MAIQPKYPILTKGVLTKVFDERARQDEKWGEQNHDSPYYYAILMEEVGEVARSIVELGALRAKKAAGSEGGWDRDGDFMPIDQAIEYWEENYRQELIEVAAVAVAMYECDFRKGRGVSRGTESVPE